jgi:hypothetical protein
MKKLPLAFFVVMILLPAQALAASQISPRDGLWLSLPPESVKCIVVRLPQDAGLTQKGNYIFSVSCTPGPGETWSDLSEQLVREVHENNTVEIPICFDTFGSKPVGNCSAPYTITVSEEFTGAAKEWRGGICVSEYGDADIVEPGDGPSTPDDARDALNDNTDMIAAWFEEEELYARPGERAVFNLSVQSQASLDINILTQSDMQVSPAQASLQTGPGGPRHQAFEVTAPSTEGTHKLTVRVSPGTCLGKSYCTKLLQARLVVSGDEPPGKEGFEVRLRPESIDIKEPEGVTLTLMVINNEDEARTITTSINTDPGDAQSGFQGESVEVGPHDSHSRVFMVTPGSSSRLYEVTVRAESRGITLSGTSFITIDEMVTDALRQAQGLGPEAQAEASAWINSHSGSEYGSDLQEYGSLRDTLASAREQAGQQQDGEDWIEEYREQYGELQDQEGDPFDFVWIALPIAAIAVIALVAVMLLRRRGGRESGDVEYY